MKPGATDAARRVELAVAAQAGADLADHAVGDRDVGVAPGRAAAVDHGAAA